MGLGDFIKKQFVDVIHYTEEGDGVLAYRFPMQDFEIQYGAQLTVRESQLALFVDEGRIADQFSPGRFTLNTKTLPLLTNLKNWDKLFQSPFKSDVYFFNTRLQLNRKWGTPNPITIRDKEFGAIRLRAFGIYTYRVADPKVFHQNVSGTRPIYTVEDLDEQLRNNLVASISDMFAESGVAFLDMASNQDEFGKRIQDKLSEEFTRLGLALDTIRVQNLSLPEELQKILDKRISMGMIGDMQRYAQFQTAESIPIAAANEGGAAGIGAGLGAGLSIGQAMTEAIRSGSAAGGGGAAGLPGATATQSTTEAMATLEKLHDLMAKGILTKEEFEAKKADILKKIT